MKRIVNSNYVEKLEDEILIEKLQQLKRDLIKYAYEAYGQEMPEETNGNDYRFNNYDAYFDIKNNKSPLLPSSDSIVHGAVRYNQQLMEMKDMSENNTNVKIAEFIPSIYAWDIRKALQAMQRRDLVTSKSRGKCAFAVRSFIEAGGISTIGRPMSAYLYNGYLPKIGFRHITTLNGNNAQRSFNAQPGDIAVMCHGKHGHICMWSGYQWVSDFPQKNMWPYNGEGICNIYRFQQV